MYNVEVRFFIKLKLMNLHIFRHGSSYLTFLTHKLFIYKISGEVSKKKEETSFLIGKI